MHETLAEVRRHAAVRALAAVLLAAAAAVLFLALLGVLADHAWPGGLPRFARQLALVLLVVGVLGAGATAAVVIRRRSLSPVYVAQLLERTGAIPHNLLVNAVLLGRQPAAGYAAAAALRQAARALAEHPGLEAVALERRRWPQLAVLAAIVAWLAYLAAAPKPIGPSLARLAGADWPAPTATRIELLRPSDAEAAHAGEPLTFEFRVTGRLPGTVHLATWTAAGTPLRDFTSARPTDEREQRHTFVLAPFEVRGDIEFVCRAGDARLQGRIPVHPRPELVELLVDLTPPAYTGWPPLRVTDPDLEVLAGTLAEFSARLNLPVTTPVLTFNAAGREVRSRMSVAEAEPDVARAGLRLVESGTYTLELRDRFGFPVHNGPSHGITVRPDAPPTVQFTAPATLRAGAVDARDVQRLAATATDDVAVHLVELVARRGPTEQRLVVEIDSAFPSVEVGATLPIAALALRPGDSVQVWFEARDGYVTPDGRPAPQVGSSPVLLLTWPAAERDTPEPEPAKPGGEAAPTDPEPGESEHAGAPGSGPQAEDGSAPNDAGEGQPSDAPGTREGAGEADAPERTERESAGSDPAGSSPEGASSGEETTGPSQATDAPGGSQRDQPPDDPDARTANGSPPSRPDSAQPPAQPAPGDEFERALERFVREHGQDAKEAGQCTGSQDAGHGTDDSGTPGGNQPATGDSTGDETSPSAPAEAGPDESPRPASGPAPRFPRVTGPLDPEGRAETIDLLELLARGADIRPDDLVASGWSRARAAEFVSALKRLHAAAQQSGGVGRLRTYFDGRRGEAGPQSGRGFSPGLRREVSPARLPETDLRRITPPPEEDVPAELYPLLEAYYRALARPRAE